ncbi:hypothetical protein RE474_09670 [Methanolobus sediminis]|uniref:Uncharacterized protein n=1 Tax=Methanolobus sediminis TaxID=3072978 RepID=A0AA51YKX7_9EURY|nr:hypothetical protein [Methanolobus sediminis]WMW24357.1 hypothetical protein RE474_09670 [Methanolobus sediminis]
MENKDIQFNDSSSDAETHINTNGNVSLNVNGVWIGLIDLDAEKEKGKFAYFKYVTEFKKVCGGYELFIDIPKETQKDKAEEDEEEKSSHWTDKLVDADYDVRLTC